MQPPARSQPSALVANSHWSCCKALMSSASRLFKMSGLRRLYPLRSREHQPELHQLGRLDVIPSIAKHKLADKCSRLRLRRKRSSRLRLLSIAVTMPPATISCAVLPPGAHKDRCRLACGYIQEVGRQGRCYILYPPCTFIKTGKQESYRQIRDGGYLKNWWASNVSAHAFASLFTEISIGGGRIARSAIAGFYRRPVMSPALLQPVR